MNSPEHIVQKIFLIRGMKVMFAQDLANLYEVETKVLNQAVKRNKERFPSDFMFTLNKEETKQWRGYLSRSQIVTLKQGTNIKYLPIVFTEHGVAMLSSVLKSKRAVEMNIFIIRAFVKLREMLATNKDLAQRMDKLELEQKDQGKLLESVYSIVKQLIDMPVKAVDKIGFDI
jgi:hypothetical protein